MCGARGYQSTHLYSTGSLLPWFVSFPAHVGLFFFWPRVCCVFPARMCVVTPTTTPTHESAPPHTHSHTRRVGGGGIDRIVVSVPIAVAWVLPVTRARWRRHVVMAGVTWLLHSGTSAQQVNHHPHSRMHPCAAANTHNCSRTGVTLVSWLCVRGWR